VGQALAAADRAAEWLSSAAGAGREATEAGARRFALTLGRALEAGLLARHAQWAADAGGGRAEAAAARRLAAGGLELPAGVDPADSRALLE
jgi:acyl-CoA dehydrogenase